MQEKYNEFVELYPNEANITPAAVTKFASDNGLTPAEKLYLCEMIAHYDKDFNAEGSNTWCNGYAAYVLYLFNGSKALMSKEADPVKNHNFHNPYPEKGEAWWTLTTKNDPDYFDMNDALADTGTWQVVDAATAQRLANEGGFVVGFAPGHVAVVAPGEGKLNTNQEFTPAVAQAGASRLLYGVTYKPDGKPSWTMSNSWRPNAYENVVFYYYNPKK
ncbi:MAG: hypothetical protein K6U80_19610 [Firmicutes bacterium]|nr:hypothetical protein [Bacillota bacterium]